MWTIIKFDKKNLEFLKRDFKQKLGEGLAIYLPKLLIQKYKKNKLVKKEINILGNYLFCFHSKFKHPETHNLLKFTKGLKYFLDGTHTCQDDIEKFITKCKEHENERGYLTQNFFKISNDINYQFTSGPFSEKIFKIINFNKNKIKILLGNFNTILKTKNFSYNPL